MTARSIAVLLFMFLGMNAVSAQTVVPQKPVDPKLVATISPQTIDSYYDALRSAIRKHAPRIVFVPGILGSKIDECQSDRTQCHPIWGTEASVTDSSADLAIHENKAYRTDVVDYLFFEDIYGSILDSLRARAKHLVTDVATDPILTVFPYDWRQSNAHNATLFADLICAIRKSAPDSPITVFAHSMGGLLTKVWLKRYSQVACSGGAMPGVTEVIFIATPHLGSPKSVKAFAEGYNLLFDELTGLKKYMGWWERNYLLAAINSAGMTFPSLYELLPIESSQNCRHSKPKLANMTPVVVGDDGKEVDLFQADTWKYYDLLRRIGAPAIRQAFYDNTLPKNLKEAEQLLCEIADYDPGEKIQVTYLVGHQKEDNTFGWFKLKVAADTSIQSWTSTSGDGTVPLYSAENTLMTGAQIVETSFDHVSIVNSPVLLTKVDTWFSDAKARAEVEVAVKKAEYRTIAVADAAATGQLLSPDLNAQGWSGEKGEMIASINRDALNQMGFTPADLSIIAANSSDPEERGRLYAVAASVTTDQSERAAWTNEVARAAYFSGRYTDAIATSEATVAEVAKASTSGKSDGKLADLAKQAAAVQAWAYLRTGNIDKYKSMTSLAVGSELKEPQSPAIAQWAPYTAPGMVLWGMEQDNPVWVMPGAPKAFNSPPVGMRNGRM